MERIDVSDWHTIRLEDEGREQNKAWIAAGPGLSREHWWLWKPQQMTGKQPKTVPRHNDVSEMLASHLARHIGLPAARCELAIRQGQAGAISQSMISDRVELIRGKFVMASCEEYSLGSILSMLAGNVGVPANCEGMSAREVFAGFTVFDAWIANTDRHDENWAVGEHENGKQSLLPSFDHGSALGSGLTDDNRRKRDAVRFCEDGKTRKYGQPRRILDVAREALDLTGAYWWAERVAEVPPDAWRGILAGIDGLSDVARTFIDDVLTTNQERVSTLCQR
ncbi:HipA family kinase [Serinicoccus kebangsaanensis]|uniref:HipA family kinase n=1 Tax=Serinicoccus kebangsaanensis TaxID=2602069 RepID=UPI00124C9D50|nr:HipA family kinase [Serinicoccus kebangsaanensis]